MFKFGKRVPKRVSLESQLQVLEQAGIRLHHDRSLDELLVSWEIEDFESEPFKMLLVALRGEIDEPTMGRWFSDDIWWLDTECIEDHDDYARIAERMAVLAKGQLPIEDVRDHVDIEAGEIWIELRLDGESKSFEPRVDNDWVDPGVFDWIASLLAGRDADGGFTYCDLGGQDCLIGFATQQQFRLLQNQTGSGFVWIR